VPSTVFPELTLLAAIGLLAGVVNAVAGGGSLLVFPALLAAGFPPLAANVTNSVSQCPGYVGIALGVILVATLSLTAHDDLRRLNAVKGVLSLVVGIVAVIVFSVGAPVDWLSVALLAPTTLAGGYLGAKLAGRLPAPVLRVAVVLIGSSVAVHLVVN
jgi:uncharacterized membrane protein YfcA